MGHRKACDVCKYLYILETMMVKYFTLKAASVFLFVKVYSYSAGSGMS